MDDNRSSAEIQHDIQAVRSDMDRTLDSLNERLSPRSLINGALDWFDSRPSGGKSLTDKPKDFARILRDNPLPALVAGAGIAWLIAEANRDPEPDYDAYLSGDHVGNRRLRAGGQDREDYRAGQFTAGANDSDGPGLGRKIKDKAGEAGDAIQDAVDGAKDKISGVAHAVSDKTSDMADSLRQEAERRRRQGRQATAKVRGGLDEAGARFKRASNEYPLGVGLGFLGLGLLAGLVIPHTDAEDEWMGESSDELADAAKEKGEELLEKGKVVATHVADKAVEEAERQGITAKGITDGVKSLGEKVGSVVEAAKDEAKSSAGEQNLTAEGLKSEAERAAAAAKENVERKLES